MHEPFATSCPDEAVFLGVAAGTIDAEARARLLTHADGCEVCHALLARVVKEQAPPSEQQTLGDRPGPVHERIVPGVTIDHYVVVATLGAGAMGEVVRARDTVLGRDVALKLLQRTPGPTWEERLVREARAMARLSHPNVVTVYGVGQWRPEGGPARMYVAMELVVGTTLRRWCEQQPRAWPELVSAWIDAGEGLAAAHAQGLVHRDFKPDNVLVGRDDRVRVVDFGLAASTGVRSEEVTADVPLSDPLTRTGELMGTPRYMAPEQLRAANVTARADQFAFAVSLYHALFGAFPYAGKSLQSLTHSYTGPPQPPPRTHAVPPAIWDALRRALDSDPDARFADMPELLARLRAVLAGRRRRRTVLATVAVGVVGIAGGIGITEMLRERPCADDPALLGGAWDDGRRTALTAVLEADIAGRITPQLDAYAQTWRDTANEVCRATHVQQVQSASQLEVRMACLADRRGRLDALVAALLADPDPEAQRRAVPAVDGLPAPGECRDIEGAPEAAELTDVRDGLQQLGALTELGHYAVARTLGEDLLARATTPWGRARARFVLSGVYDDHGDEPRMTEALRAGLLDAAEAGDAEVVARFWLGKLAASAEHQRYEVAAEQLVAARVAAQGADLRPRLRFEIAIAASRLHTSKGEAESAKGEAEVALAAAQELGSPLARASALQSRAKAYSRMGRHDDAIRDARDALALRSETLGERHPDSTRGRQVVASMLQAAGRASEAREVLAEALAMAEAELGAESQLAATMLAGLAVVDAQLGAFEPTIAEGTRAIELFERTGMGDVENAVYVRVALTHAYQSLGRLADAERTSSEAVAIQERLLGDRHPALLVPLIGRGELRRRMKQHAGALADFERVLAIANPRSMDAAFALTGVGFARRAMGERAAARDALVRALELHREFGSEASVIAEVERALDDLRESVER